MPPENYGARFGKGDSGRQRAWSREHSEMSIVQGAEDVSQKPFDIHLEFIYVLFHQIS